MSGIDLRHALAVAGRVDDLDAKVVALLHDALEDGACTEGDLHEAYLPDDVVMAVQTLTRSPGETYANYIARIKAEGDELAILVKLADLEANLARIDEEHSGLEGRYRKAIQTLTWEHS